MELAFVALHKDCPKLEEGPPPKFGFEGAADEGNVLYLRCALCGKFVHLTITEVENADAPVPELVGD